MKELTSILVTDGEKPMRRLLSLYLRQFSCATEEAAAGEEALAAIRREKYKLILL